MRDNRKDIRELGVDCGYCNGTERGDAGSGLNRKRTNERGRGAREKTKSWDGENGSSAAQIGRPAEAYEAARVELEKLEV